MEFPEKNRNFSEEDTSPIKRKYEDRKSVV